MKIAEKALAHLNLSTEETAVLLSTAISLATKAFNILRDETANTKEGAVLFFVAADLLSGALHRQLSRIEETL